MPYPEEPRVLDRISGENSDPVDQMIDILTQPCDSASYIRQIEILENELPARNGYEQIDAPNCKRVYVIGDIHARPEALAKALKSLNESAFKRSSTLDQELNNGETIFLFVGDLVHAEGNRGNFQHGSNPQDRLLIEERNLNTVIAVAGLKAQYPYSFFVVKGNHDNYATIPGMIGKMGVDQGASLRNVIQAEGLDVPLQTILDKLPLLVEIQIGLRHIILSHALPVAELSVAEIARLLAKKKRPFPFDESLMEYIKGVWGKDRLTALRNISQHNKAIRDLLTLARTGNFASGSLGPLLQLGEKLDSRLDESEIYYNAISFFHRYLFLLVQFLFSEESYNDKISVPGNVLWVVGHEPTPSGGVRDISKLIQGIDNRQKAIETGYPKIIQINNPNQLPVFGLKIDAWDTIDFTDLTHLRLF